jgi:hypothetical protein
MIQLLRDKYRNRINRVDSSGAIRGFGDYTLSSDEPGPECRIIGQKRKGGENGGEGKRVIEGIGVKPE